jgi:hypothetical protein
VRHRGDTLRRARRAYEVAHVVAAVRALAIAVALIVLAIGLHRVTETTWLVGAGLAASLVVFAWRGGAWRRGGLAGTIAGLPPLIVPSLVFALSVGGGGGHCASCEPASMLPCMIACFGSSSLVGMLVGHRAYTDASPSRFALAAITSAALMGLLGCGTTGLGGAVGVVLGLVAGGVAGWIVAGRTAHA